MRTIPALSFALLACTAFPAATRAGDAVGACCLSDDLCTEAVTQAACEADGCGVWHGPGTVCPGVICDRVFGACCAAGVCRLVEHPFPGCPDGTFEGCGSSCASTTCPPALGACCLDDACLPSLTEKACTDQCGLWLGFDSVCDGSCPGAAVGACCLNGSCVPGITEDACACAVGAEWIPGTTDCATVTCAVPPVGACCIDAGCTPGLTQYDCVVNQCGAWQGPGAGCGGTQCATLIGVCCLDGMCMNIGQDACQCAGGTFQSGSTNCSGTLCPGGPTGACCVDGACLAGVTQQECVAGACGAWSGAGTTCTVSCPLPLAGVCCRGGVCDGSTAGPDACACSGGTWNTTAASCAGVTCPIPTGRCCYGAMCTPNVTAAACGCGIFTEGVGCPSIDPGLDPDPDFEGGIGIGNFACGSARGACCLPDGSCSANLGRTTCTCEGGTWRAGGGCTLTNANHDCDGDGIIDWCVDGFTDCNNDEIPDSCQADCNGNGVTDECDIASQDSSDCNANGTPDECEIDVNSTAPGGPFYCTMNCARDCNENGVPDSCDLADGTSTDCNANDLPDECEIDATSTAPGGPFFCMMDCDPDCNDNGVPDACDLDPDCALNLGIDCNVDGVLDGCDPDCNASATSDVCELIGAPGNGIIDCAGPGGTTGSNFLGMLVHNANCASCHGEGGYGGIGPNHRGYSRHRYAQKTSGCVFHVGGAFNFTDQQYADIEAWLSELGGAGNGVPDGCEELPDCDADGVADTCALNRAQDPSQDCDGNGIPDECDLAGGLYDDCNANGIPDPCDPQDDCNGNGQIDDCDILQGISADCTANGIPDECEADCQPNGVADSCDIAIGSVDCDANGVPDECEADCNSNGVNDVCDISAGTSVDVNANGIPDECEPDCNQNGATDDLDLLPGDQGLLHIADYSGLPGGGLAVADCTITGQTPLIDAVEVDFDDACGQVEILRVGVHLEHSWLGDVVLQLRSPSGSRIALMSRPGLDEVDPYCSGDECCGNGANTLDATFGDGFAVSAESAVSFVGSLAPHAGATGLPAALATFAGEPMCGEWTLEVYDGSIYDDGLLVGWSLDFRAEPVSIDCNGNGVPDECEIDSTSTAPGGPFFCSMNCDPDCDNDGVPDGCQDCNANGVGDACDIAAGDSADCDGNGIPDECDEFRDCDANGVMDSCDIALGLSSDCDANGAPDKCDIDGTAGFFVSALLSANVAEYDPVSLAQQSDLVPPGGGGLTLPLGMAYTATGQLLVGDVTPPSIRAYDADTGAYLRDLVPGNNNAGLQTPIDVEIHPDGSILVLDLPNRTVRRYDATFGANMGAFITLPAGEVAYDMVYAPTGELLIANFTTGQILAYDGVTGAPIGPHTTGGTLLNPVALTFNGAGELFVADVHVTNDNVQRFDAAGAFVEVFVPALATNGQLTLIKMAFGPEGHLYATHAALGAVVRFHGDDGAMFDLFPTNGVQFPFGLVFRPPSNDCNGNDVPDECEDCNGNALADSCDLASGVSVDANGNGVPDECEGADVALALVIRESISQSDAATTLPSGITAVTHGAPFFIELWATDRGPVNTGLLQIATEVGFTPGVVTAVGIDHRAPFDETTFGFIDNAAGSIGSLGGFNSSGAPVGIEPEWRRIAIVDAVATDCGPAVFTTAEDLPGIFRIDRGLISNVDYGGATLEVVRRCPYDLDGSGFINAAEIGLLAPCWLSTVGDLTYDPACDFDCSGVVNAGDLGWFAGAWMQFCDGLPDSALPVCQRCGLIDIESTGEDGGGEARGGHRPKRLSPRHPAPSPQGPTLALGWQVDSVKGAPGQHRVEVSVRDERANATGVAAAYVEVAFDPSWAVADVAVGAAFPAFSLQVVEPGVVRIGGAALSGVEATAWIPLATVILSHPNRAGTPAVSVRPSPEGVAPVGGGALPAAAIRIEHLR